MGIAEQMEFWVAVRVCLGDRLFGCILQSEDRQTRVFVEMFNRMTSVKLWRGFAEVFLVYGSVRKSARVPEALMALGWVRRCFQVPEAS